MQVPEPTRSFRRRSHGRATARRVRRHAARVRPQPVRADRSSAQTVRSFGESLRRRLRQRLQDVEPDVQRQLSDRHQPGRRRARGRAVCSSEQQTTNLRDLETCIVTRGARRGAQVDDEPEARRSDAEGARARRTERFRREEKRFAVGLATPSSCSRRSAISRASRTTSWRRSSTTTGRWLTSRQCRARRSAVAACAGGRGAVT